MQWASFQQFPLPLVSAGLRTLAAARPEENSPGVGVVVLAERTVGLEVQGRSGQPGFSILFVRIRLTMYELANTLAAMLDTLIIPFQPTLPKALPTIEGNVDYRDLRDQLLRMDQLLIQSGLETQLLEARLQRWLGEHPQASPRAQQNQQLHSRRALRCNLARILIRETPRGFAARLADSPLLQFFCDLSELGRVKVPAKSTLQRYSQWWGRRRGAPTPVTSS